MLAMLLLVASQALSAQERRPIDSKHPLWLVHVDVWNKADPQKIIDLIPDDIKPYVCMNLSLSCQYDTEKNVYKMPQNAVKTYKSWATVCQANGLWFMCQPASGGHTHIQDDDLETFEYFYKRYPNFLGWNYAEQFWGFDEANDRSSSSQSSRIALFAKLVPMAHQYGGFLTISFCGNVWSHPLNPVGMMKRNRNLLQACRDYPEAILWLYKYTTSSCFYNNESVTWSPFVSGLAKNYGVRYDNCGWNGALEALLGKDNGKKYPVAAGIGTVMEQCAVNGGAVWDGPELIWTEDFEGSGDAAKSTVNGYTRRGWKTYKGFDNAWIDMFRKIIDGTIYIPTREEVVGKTKIAVINDVSSGNDEAKYAAWGDLYDGLYKQTDPFNRNDGQWMDNFCYFKKTGRYGAIPVCVELYDDLAKSIPVQVKKSTRSSRWPSTGNKKVTEFNNNYPQVSTGDLYVNRYRNQLVTYTPYTYLNKKITASADIPLQYNTCEKLQLTYGKLSSGLIREYSDSITFYLNNYRTDTTTQVIDKIVLVGAAAEPTCTFAKRGAATVKVNSTWDAATGTDTIEVSHMGPVDLVIKCSGTATERATDVLPNTPLSADLPKQPEAYTGEITIEAEDMDYKNVASCVLDPYGWYPSVRGHAGNGFMDMGTNTSAALRHILYVDEAGDYTVSIRYTSPSRDAVIATQLNGRNALVADKTATNEWRKITFTATMKAGKNTLTITNTGGTSGLYIDNVTYTPAGVEPETFAISLRQAEHGQVLTDKQQAAEGEAVTLTVMPDEGYQLTGWNVLHGSVEVNENGTFLMPDDNVTLQPIFTDVTSVYALDLTDVLAGTLPKGWRAVQEDEVTHAYPDTYNAGGRVLAGFNGYQGKALYWRNNSADYGVQATSPLMLQPGCYKLTFATAAWKETPSYKAQILNASGTVVAETSTLTAAPNCNGNAAANVKTSTQQELPFRIETAGKYTIRFTDATTSGGYHEFLLLQCRVNTAPDPAAIHPVNPTDPTTAPAAIYSPSGQQRRTLQPGLNIVRTKGGQVHKVFK